MKIRFIILFVTILSSERICVGQNNHTLNEANKLLQKDEQQFFIENKGQWHPDVLYLTRMRGLDVWITKQGMNYTFYNIERNEKYYSKFNKSIPQRKFNQDIEDEIVIGHRVILDFENNNTTPIREGKQKLEGYYNYLKGNDSNKHATNVGLYKEIIVKNLYENIDIRYYFDKGYLRYDFLLQKGADPNKIRFTLKGQYSEDLKDNTIIFTTRFGEVRMAELHTYQKNNIITSWFEKQGNTWQIALDYYDKTQPLIIDPLIYSTYIGGNSDDMSYSIVADGNGSAYITGTTESIDYSVTPGAFQTTHNGMIDVFVTKLNAAGSNLVYSTFLGGSKDDYGYDIAIDANENVYITGTTLSDDYDTTAGAFQTLNGGGRNEVFVTKLNASGTALIYSTYIGGNSGDMGYSIAIDGSGFAYITGYTGSPDFDTTAGAFQTTIDGYGDIFVTKLNVTGTGLVYSTFLGGNNIDIGYGIAVDNSGIAYIVGSTESTDYPVTSGAIQTTQGGFLDVIVTKLNASGTGLIYSTFIGGNFDEVGYGVATDGNGNAYITGYTKSPSYPVTLGAFKTTKPGSTDVFVTKLNALGTGLIYSTFIGGISDEEGYDMVVDGNGYAYISGSTNSQDYDVTQGAYQTTNDGNAIFITKLNIAGTSLVYSTYVGGSSNDSNTGIAIDGNGNAYITGYTESTSYPVTAGAFKTTTNGLSWEAIVTKLDISGTNSFDQHIQYSDEFKIYPNPNHGEFIIEHKMGFDEKVELLDLMGKVLEVFTIKPGKNNLTFDLSAGLYLIRTIENGYIQKVKIE